MSVFLNNLDDFIAPSQACVNPFVAQKGGTGTAGTAGGVGGASTSSSNGSRITLQADFSSTEFDLKLAPVAVQPNVIRARSGGAPDQQVASVSLNDCLACSGCVTSAETVLIQEQSFEKLLARLASRAEDNCLVVVALSPQSRASLAAQLGTSSGDAFLRVAAALKSLGVTYVADAASAGDVALLEARDEFLRRHRMGRSAAWDTPPTTTAASSTRIHVLQGTAGGGGAAFGGAAYAAEPLVVGPVSLEAGAVADPCASAAHRLGLPMLVSSCPGWVCYAEKTQPQALPYMSTTKSAQQILGAVMKRLVAPDRSVYVVSVQPCFDKKLEASRLDFFHDDSGQREVDLVISTTELWSLIGSLAPPPQTVGEFLAGFAPDAPHGRDDAEAMLRAFSPDGLSFVSSVDSNAGSGGFLDYVFRHAAMEVCGVDLWGGETGSGAGSGAGAARPALDLKVGRNPDMAEVVVEEVSAPGGGGSGNDDMETERPRKLRFARAYGFRNIQSVMLKMKRGQCDWDFVEIMACPSGCANGGGQLKAAVRESPSEVRGRVALVEAELHSCTLVARPEDSPLARFIYAPQRLGGVQSANAVELLHTRYHAVPKLELVAPLAAKW